MSLSGPLFAPGSTLIPKNERLKRCKMRGLSVSDALRLLMLRIADEHRMPFEIKVPNATTRKAMEELESGKGELSVHRLSKETSSEKSEENIKRPSSLTLPMSWYGCFEEQPLDPHHRDYDVSGDGGLSRVSSQTRLATD